MARRVSGVWDVCFSRLYNDDIPSRLNRGSGERQQVKSGEEAGVGWCYLLCAVWVIQNKTYSHNSCCARLYGGTVVFTAKR